MKEEKGAITLFVLVSCMFMIVILLIVNIGVMNKNRSQEKNLEEIAKQYSQNETDLDNVYEKVTNENEYLTVSEMRDMFYPVGSIYITTNNQNPSEYIGGKWESYGEGRTIVGAGTGTDENNVQKVFEINQTGGEYQHTLTVNEMPSHNHLFGYRNGNSSGFYYSRENGQYINYWLGNGNTDNTQQGQTDGKVTIDYTGGNQAHNNIQPYIVTYMWKRIS